MNFIKKIITTAVCLLLILTHTTCKREWFSRVTYDGYVYNKNGTPVQGTSIILQACDGHTNREDCLNHKYLVGVSTSDASGHFHIYADAARSNLYFVSMDNGILGWNVEGVSSSELSAPNFTKLTLY